MCYANNIFFISLLTTLFSQAQTIKQDSAVIYPGGSAASLLFVSEKDNCNEAGRMAVQDISAKHSFLLLQSGIAPVVYPSDVQFQQQFHIRYWEQGCAGTANLCAIAYKNEVFNYLTSTYGKKWVKLVRQDVIGLKQWKKSHHKR